MNVHLRPITSKLQSVGRVRESAIDISFFAVVYFFVVFSYFFKYNNKTLDSHKSLENK